MVFLTKCVAVMPGDHVVTVNCCRHTTKEDDEKDS